MKSLNRTVRRSGRRAATTALIAGSLGAILVLAGCAPAGPSGNSGSTEFTPVEQDESSTTTVWVDSTRLPGVEAYQAAHPDAKLDIVTYDGGADGSAYLQSKIQLFDRSGSGWPDVVFAGALTPSVWASEPTGPDAIPFAAPLDADLVDQDVIDGFADGTLAPCETGGHLYCLRNDIAQVVLWYNKTLLDEFGYAVPTTWEEYKEIGEKIAVEHPGYLVGAVGDTNAHNSYFWASQCPANELQDDGSLLVNLQDEKCTRMASLLDDLIGAGSVSTDAFFSAGFAENQGPKVVMAYGPSWFGQYLFNAGFKTPAGQIAAAPPLAWEGESDVTTGNVGGGIWLLSSHSKNLKAATDLLVWMSTSDEYQGSAPTYPAFKAAAKTWLENPEIKAYFANDVSDAFQTAAGEVWDGWSNVSFSDQTPWSSIVLTGLTEGKTITELLPAWQDEITNLAKSVGYTVTNG